MRPLGVVVAPPCFDDDLCLGEAVEDFAVEEFVAKLRVEALAVVVLPRAARLDERGLCADAAIHSRTALAMKSCNRKRKSQR